MSSFKGDKIQTQYVLSSRTDLYFHEYKLVMEIDEMGTATKILTTK